jgi:molybdate-binding protein
LGLESAARAFGLDFVFLTRERYDLVMEAETTSRQPVQQLLTWLASEEGKEFVSAHPGYESQDTGKIQK